MSDSIVLGIDFGTTNSCISYYDGNKIHVIQNREGNYTTPSCLYFDKFSNDIIIGEIAYNLLQSNNNSLYLGNIIYNIKRLIGIKYSHYKSEQFLVNFFNKRGIKIVQNHQDEYCGVEMIYNNNLKVISIYNICLIYIKYLIDIAKENVINCTDVVITVPVYFTSIQREILENICKEIGLNVIRIINEPTAAALAYQGNQKYKKIEPKIENILVIDCGGGTTDLSLLEMDYINNIYKVLNVIGDNYMGGEDITNLLLEYVLNKIEINNPTSKELNKIKRECEKAKCTIGFSDNIRIYIENLRNEKDYIINLSLTQFYNLSYSFFDKIKTCIQNIRIGYNIDKIILVGGSTQIPYFKTLINSVYDNIEIYDTLNNLQAISIGASIQGYLLNRNSNVDTDIDFDIMDIDTDTDDVILMDVINLSLGVATEDDIIVPIISNNTIIPTSNTKMFTNSQDYITELEIDIYQGNRIFVKDNIKIGTLKLVDLDNTLKKGEMRISITFNIDANGIIHVIAKEMTTNKYIDLFIKNENNFNVIHDIDFDNIIQDNYKSLQVLYKLELDNTCREIYHQIKKNTYFIQNLEIMNKIEKIYNDTQDIIKDYNNYTPKFLKDYKTIFINTVSEIKIVQN